MNFRLFSNQLARFVGAGLALPSFRTTNKL
jgi:hypothetical protein